MFLSVYSSVQNILQLIGIIIVFLIILAAAYAASIVVGKTQGNAYSFSKERNIRLIETFRISNGQFLQIVKIGNHYFALAVSKEHIELIAELDEEEVYKDETTINAVVPFQNVLEAVKKKLPKMQKEEKK